MAEYEIHPSSGNIFADLGLPNPEMRLVKAEACFRVRELVEKLGLTQEQAADRMRLRQSEVSKLLNGRVAGFSLDRLIRCLNALDQNVEIRIGPKEPGQEHGRLLIATAT